VRGLGRHALAYATGRVFEWPVPVFPLRPRGKTPLTPRGFKDASLDPEQVEAWWRRWPDANVGLPTGRASRLLVVDLDGDEGACSWGVLLSAHPGTPPETAVRTGGGGWHLFYRFPDGPPLGNSAGRLAPAIDTRGEGGYVVAPPSVHPSGARYSWTAPPRGEVVAPPAWLVGQLTARPAPSERPWRPPPAPLVRGGTPYGLAGLEAEVRRVADAPEGARNDTLNRAAFAAGQLVAGGELGAETAVAALEGAAAEAGLGSEEARATIRSGILAGVREPRSSSARGGAS
jgi:hypothetical protein